jgi:type VI secretion system protein ImpM
MSERPLDGTRSSLFGKLAAKRDFIALSAPRDFLNVWEPWMQSCVSASRDKLKEGWLDAYLTAPIWRFWLGSEICGATVLGAVMSSLDGMGRYYPLTLFAYSDHGDGIPPPDLDPHDDWFSSAEALLLSTLDNDLSFEEIASALESFAGPVQTPASEADSDSSTQAGILGAGLSGRSFTELFAALRIAHFSSVYAAATFWWTIGGGDCEPFGFCCQRMPPPSSFIAMLTGRLASLAEAEDSA